MAESWYGLDTEENFQLLKGTSCVQVCVGSGDDCWALQLNLLCHVSTFFKAALSNGFKEAQEKRVTLREDDPAVFEIFAVWLYTGEIPWLKTPDNLLPLAWILGDKLGAPAFQNCAMSELITPSGNDFPWHPQIVEHIYNNTTEGSLLRAATVDNLAFYHRELKDREAEFEVLFARGGDFGVDMFKTFLRWADVKDPALVLDKYLLEPKAQLPLDGPLQAGNTPVEDPALVQVEHLPRS